MRARSHYHNVPPFPAAFALPTAFFPNAARFFRPSPLARTPK